METQNLEFLTERLRGAGFRATGSRLSVARALAEAGQPLGTPALAEKLVPGEMDLATLYRTLKSFEEKGLVRNIPIDQRFASYEWTHEEEGHHHHVVCRSCGRIEEIPQCHLEALEKSVLETATHFSAITSHSLEFFGVCDGCVS